MLATLSSLWREYRTALITTAVVSVVTLLAGSLGDRTAFTLYLAAVVVSAYFGGIKAGGLATALSALALDFQYRLALAGGRPRNDGDYLTSLILFLLLGLLVSYLTFECVQAIRLAARYHDALESLPDAVVAVDGRDRVTFLNRAARSLTGWLNANAVGKPVEGVFELTAEEDRHQLQQMLSRPGTVAPTTAALRGHDGSERPVEFWTRAYQPGGTLLMFREGAAQPKQPQDSEPQRQLDRIAALTASAPVGLILLDRDGRCVYSNRAYREAFGFSLEDGFEGCRSVHPEDRQLVAEWKASAQKGETCTREFRLWDGDSKVRWVRLRSEAARAESGEVVGHVGALEDITEIRKAAEELAEQRKKAEAIQSGSKERSEQQKQAEARVAGLEKAKATLEQQLAERQRVEEAMRRGHAEEQKAWEQEADELRRRLEATGQASTGELSQARERTAELERQLAEGQKHLAELEQKLKDRRKNDEVQRKQAAAWKQQEADLRRQLTEAQQEVNTLRQQLEEWKQKETALQSQAGAWQERESALQRQLAEGQQQLAALRRQVEESERRDGGLRGQLDEVQRHEADLRRRLDELQKVYDGAKVAHQAERRAAEEERAEWQRKLATADEACGRAAYLAEAGRSLATLLDPDEAAQGIAALAVPRLAGVCVVRKLNADGAAVPVAIAVERGADGPQVWGGEALKAALLGTPEDGRSLRADKATLDLEAPASVRDEVARALAEAGLPSVEIRSALTVPLSVEGRPVLSVLLARDTDYGDSDVSLAQEFGQRAALALTAALRHGEACAGRDKLARRLTFLRGVLSSVGEGVCTLDRDERIIFLNPAAERLLGKPEAELFGKKLHEVLTVPELGGSSLLQVLGERPLLRSAVPSGGLELDCTITPLVEKDVCRGVVAALRDSTERRQREDQLRTDLARAVETARGGEGWLERLALRLRPEVDELRNADGTAEDLTRRVQRLAALTDGLETAARLGRGEVSVKRRAVELSHVTGRAAEACEGLLRLRGQHLTVALPLQPVFFEADAVLLEQALGHLLENAARYSKAGAEIRLTAERDGDEIVLSVRDGGAGIAGEDMPRLHALGARSRSFWSDGTGPGLGVAVARDLAELHGGKLTIHSDGPGRGSEFVLRLPAVESLAGAELLAA